jgi:predicted amidohydrolase
MEEQMYLDFLRILVLSVLASGRATASEAGQATERDVAKVAAVQVCGYDKGYVERPGFDPAKVVVTYIQKASEDGAQLVVFPEYLLGRITVPGPVTRKIAQAAAAAKIYVVVGCWEVHADNSFANTALLFDRQGHIQGKYLKTHAAVDTFEGTPSYAYPPAGRSTEWFIQNDPEWIMKKGHDLPVFNLDFARVGIITCYDGWFPEPFRVLSLKGAEVIIWINGRRGHVEDYIVKAAMFQNSVALVTANQAYGGGTMIADWPATIKAVCPPQEQACISATINLKRLRRIRKHSRNYQQRRPELYGEILKKQTAWGESMENTN